MKRLALILCTLALLTACGEEPLDWTPTPATPQPTPTPSAETEAPWAALTVDDLPTALAEPDDLFPARSRRSISWAASSRKAFTFTA